MTGTDDGLGDNRSVFEKMQHPVVQEALRKDADLRFKKDNPVIAVYEHLLEQIRAFQEDLPSTHEVGAYIAGWACPVHIRSIEGKNPSTLIIKGTDDNNVGAVLMQHTDRLDIRLVSLPKAGENSYRMGFVHHDAPVPSAGVE